METPDHPAQIAPEAFANDQEGIVTRPCLRCGLQRTGRQTKYCERGDGKGSTCAQIAWAEKHPRVSPSSTKRRESGSICKALLAVMEDGQFRTVQALAELVGALPASVSARIRELRAKGHHILRDHRRGDASVAHRYALKRETPA